MKKTSPWMRSKLKKKNNIKSETGEVWKEMSEPNVKCYGKAVCSNVATVIMVCFSALLSKTKVKSKRQDKHKTR